MKLPKIKFDFVVIVIIIIVVIIIGLAIYNYFFSGNSSKNDGIVLNNQPPAIAPDIPTIVGNLQDAYETHWYKLDYMNMDSSEAIVQPLATAANAMQSQTQWAAVVAGYQTATGSDLFTDVDKKLGGSIVDGIFSHSTAGLTAVQNYLLTLPA